jgi:hypothetical protein
MAQSNDGWVDEQGWQDEAPPKGYPNPDAHSNPVAPAIPEKTLLQRFLSPPGHGAAGGIVGGTIGGLAAGLPGAMGGAFLGNLAGQKLRVGEEAVDPQAMAQYRKQGRIPTDYKPAPPSQEGVDLLPAVGDAAMQGATGAAFKGLGYGAAKLGFPRLGAVLGFSTPREAVLSATPEAVKGISTPALQSVDAAGLAGNSAAKEIAAISAEQARRDAHIAIERGIAEANLKPLQDRMASRVPALAQKSGVFADELRKLGLEPDLTRKAFADAPAVMEAAESQPVMQARQGMIQEAVPQATDAKALKLATRPVAAASARGVSQDAVPHAADAVGLRELGGTATPNVSFLNRVANRIPGVGAATQLLPQGGMRPAAVTQSAAAILGERGIGSVNPAIEKLVSNNPAYRLGTPTPQFIEALLRRYAGQ